MNRLKSHGARHDEPVEPPERYEAPSDSAAEGASSRPTPSREAEATCVAGGITAAHRDGRSTYDAGVARPYRLAPPAGPTAGVIGRDRLATVLDERWSRRLTTVIAGPGFGKTSLLGSALASARRDDVRDVWLSCEPGDEDAAYLLAGLAASAGYADVEDVAALCRAIWLSAPTQVCLVLDDVHEIPDDSSGMALLDRLVAELPRNATVVLSSRTMPPCGGMLPRLAASGQHRGLTEDDLLFDDDELERFASARGVERALLEESGGWPALAELTVASTVDLAFEYVWDEVLTVLGPDRAQQLATLAIVGGGDRAVCERIVGHDADPIQLAEGAPLVDVRVDGWVVPHRLWVPVARRLLSADAVRTARLAAADVHASAGRLERAVDLLTEAEAWPELSALIRDVAVHRGLLEHWQRIGAWRQRLPTELRAGPVALLAEGMARASRAPLDAIGPLEAAAQMFRSEGDGAGEVAAIERLGVVKWWASDVGGVWELYLRAQELAESGVHEATVLTQVGTAAIAHLTGDPVGVLAALEPLGSADSSAWAPGIWWFRHVAHRRLGDIERAEMALDWSSRLPGEVGPRQTAVARLRTDWLLGRVDDVAEGMLDIADSYGAGEQGYLRTETALEAAARFGWLGNRASAMRILSDVEPRMGAAPGPVVRIHHAIAAAAIAIDAGDEDAARQVLVESGELVGPHAAERWYWWDRAAVAVPHQLIPTDRSGWESSVPSPLHRIGLELSGLLTSARSGELEVFVGLDWPPPGVIRANLPARWIQELVDAADAVGHPAPIELVAALPPRSPSARRGTAGPTSVPGRPSSRPTDPSITVLVLGPLMVMHGDRALEHPDLQRTRVRELLALLAVEPVQRRERLADLIWPEHPDPRQNLRVTLSYLRGALDSTGTETGGGVLHADRSLVRLVAGSGVACDLWQFEQLLREAERAEAVGDPEQALHHYGAAIALWRGPALGDVVDNDHLVAARRRLTTRLTGAVERAGDLWLAGGRPDDALRAAEVAIAADPDDEPARRLAARAHLARGDVRRARGELEQCIEVLRTLGVGPSHATEQLIRDLAAAGR